MPFLLCALFLAIGLHLVLGLSLMQLAGIPFLIIGIVLLAAIITS